MCTYSTRPGRFRIRGKRTLDQDAGFPFLSEPVEPVVKWIRPARFRLRRAG